MSLAVRTITTTYTSQNTKSHTFIRLLLWRVKKKTIPSFMTIVLVDARFRDDIKGDLVDPDSKSSQQSSP